MQLSRRRAQQTGVCLRAPRDSSARKSTSFSHIRSCGREKCGLDGHQLLSVDPLGESQLSTLVPLTHALVIVRHAGRTLLVFNRGKQYWELPGGMIDPGETARACAGRELLEETSQPCEELELQFVGAMKFKLRSASATGQPRVEFGALYHLQLSEVRPFNQNDEVSRICWWDGKESIGAIDTIDEKLSQWPLSRPNN